MGSEMCIRDRAERAACALGAFLDRLLRAQFLLFALRGTSSEPFLFLAQPLLAPTTCRLPEPFLTAAHHLLATTTFGLLEPLLLDFELTLLLSLLEISGQLRTLLALLLGFRPRTFH